MKKEGNRERERKRAGKVLAVVEQVNKHQPGQVGVGECPEADILRGHRAS